MSSEFQKFRSIALDDRDVQQALDAAPDSGEFVALASRLAQERGIELRDDEVLRELANAREKWLLRMLP